MIKIEIKNRWTGDILFEYTKENNTIKDTVLEAIKHGADLYGANLYGADLCGADLYGANLCNADLHGADLYGANLYGADLCGADLCGANLCDANLHGANLYGANLCDANLYGADLHGAILDYNDNNDGYGEYQEKINSIQENSNLASITAYENHDSYSSKWGCFWKNLLIIRQWKIKEEIEEITREQAEEELSRIRNHKVKIGG